MEITSSSPKGEGSISIIPSLLSTGVGRALERRVRWDFLSANSGYTRG